MQCTFTVTSWVKLNRQFPVVLPFCLLPGTIVATDLLNPTKESQLTGHVGEEQAGQAAGKHLGKEQVPSCVNVTTQAPSRPKALGADPRECNRCKAG